MDTVEQRIAQLEQRLERAARTPRGRSGYTGRGMRLIRLTGVCGMAVTAGALTMGTAAAKPGPQPLTVKAPFTVVTGSGKAVQIDALGQLTLYHAGHPIIVLGPGADAVGLVQALTPGGEPVAELSSLANGTGQLAVVGDEGQVARLGASPNVLNQLMLRFYQGKTELAGFGADKKGGLAQVNDAMGNKMALLGSNGKSGSVSIYDTTGSARGLLSTDLASGEGELDLLYRDGKTPAVQLSEVSSGGYLALTNRSGTARVEGGTLPGSDVGILRAFGPGGFDFVRGRK